VISSSIALWAVLAALAALLLQIQAGTAVAMGLAALILHWFSEFVHQLGHAVAAQRTGHPMIGVRFWGLLSTSLYPEEEPPLPADVHIRRALGGPVASLVLSFIAWALMAATRAEGGPVWWVAVFFLAENALFLTLQAFIPLGNNDGATLWRWLRRR
jgi:Zn-dependent protease